MILPMAVQKMHDRGCVVLLGDFSNERLNIASIASEFSWSVAQTPSVAGLREISRSCTVMTVLVKASGIGALGMPWPEALRAVRAAAPRARIILCHKADQAHARTEMVDAGAFGVLLSPLAYSEVRQLLGFVWASKITPLQHVPAVKRIRSIDTAARHVGAA
jgi:DNA-binding NarL/FixJ family response regulator